MFPEPAAENNLDGIAMLTRSFQSLVKNISEQERLFTCRVEGIKAKQQALAARYQETQLLARRLQEIASLDEILFNISDERELYLRVVNFLHKLYPRAIIRFLGTTKSQTKMSVLADYGSPDGDQRMARCIKNPLECLAIKRCRPVVFLQPDDHVFCCELSDLAGEYGYLCMPLIADGSAFGCVNIMIKREDMPEKGPPLQENDFKLLDLLTTHTALAINNNRLIKTVRREALTDRLTGLPNRRYAQEALQSEINRCARYNSVFSLALLDIDLFKTINDNFGHDEGDRILTLLAEAANKCLRKVDTTARYGGEEFLIILPQTEIENACLVIERFRKTFNQLTLSGTIEAKNITLSAGLSEFPADGEDASTLIKIADDRLYMAKRAGRNRMIWNNKI